MALVPENFNPFTTGDESKLVQELTSAVCSFCQHIGDSPRTCKAFPKGIPNEIWYAEHDHQVPYPGDHGVRFKLNPTLKPAYLAQK